MTLCGRDGNLSKHGPDFFSSVTSADPGQVSADSGPDHDASKDSAGTVEPALYWHQHTKGVNKLLYL